MDLSEAALITVTASYTALVTVCWTYYRLSWIACCSTHRYRYRKFDHIMVALFNLHWLTMRQRIRFKLALIVFKCLHGRASSYLADDCIVSLAASGRRHLRSADTTNCRHCRGVRRIISHHMEPPAAIDRNIICYHDFSQTLCESWKPESILRGPMIVHLGLFILQFIYVSLSKLFSKWRSNVDVYDEARQAKFTLA